MVTFEPSNVKLFEPLVTPDWLNNTFLSKPGAVGTGILEPVARISISSPTSK